MLPPGRLVRNSTSILIRRLVGIIALLGLLAGCGAPAAPSPVPPTAVPAPLSTPLPSATPGSTDLSDEQMATLSSLERVDGYPLYTMHYRGAYEQAVRSPDSGGAAWAGRPGLLPASWACSLFTALGDTGQMLYGRNFDWDYSPALLLFTDPPDGYASVSMVDIAYLGFEGDRARTLTDLPLSERSALLEAPFLPFDGMNERGLVVGMAAVPGSEMPNDSSKETADSLLIIREMLDHAASVDEAVAILQRYNVDWGGGPPLHYLIAAPPGRAVLVEFYQGKMVVIANEAPWHLATNFLLSAAGESAEGQCWRYDQISRRLQETGGRLSAPEAMDLLAGVSQEGTQWSVVYEVSAGEVTVSMGRQYSQPHTIPCWPRRPVP